ncbi:MAG TPA: O-antigen ligase family protein [Thermodesulfobacteriota bacterium]|nr:O-antigen ligase family protein [Thermodesulfobacteriota bacterium]
MFNTAIKLLLIALILFTPFAFGSMEIWSLSLMELGILFILILWAIRTGLVRLLRSERSLHPAIDDSGPDRGRGRRGQSAIPLVLLALFLLVIGFQIIPLPSGILKIISPRTFSIRSALSLEPSASSFPLSFSPFLTQIEFFKWLTLAGLFVFLLGWRPLEESDRARKQLLAAVMTAGVLESLYGMFEFFSGHHHILNVAAENFISSATGTFINRNYFAGYLLMVIPLSMGFLFSREAGRTGRYRGWRHGLSSLDGKTLLIGFGVIVMILGLLFSASRMGIVSLLLSFSLISLFFLRPRKEGTFSRTSILILGLAILWAAWIGLDAVINRFFMTSESLKGRWEFWVNTFQIYQDFPIFGSGLGTFVQIFPMYRSFHIIGLVTHAENDFLQLLSEVGTLGTGLLAVLFFFLLWKIASGIRALAEGEPARYIALGGLVGILSLMFHSLVERNIQIPANAFLYAFILALVLRIALAGNETPRNQ